MLVEVPIERKEAPDIKTILSESSLMDWILNQTHIDMQDVSA